VENDIRRAGTSPRLSRRSLIDVLLGSSLVAWIAAVVYPVLKYLTPSTEGGGGNKVTLTDGQKQELQSNGFLIARLGTDRVLLLKDRDQKLRALSAKCTHEGCTVQFLPNDAVIWCACHNGKFAPDGRVISGPPPRPLAAFTVEGSLPGDVSIVKPGGVA
jgi:cytochrome b6-f complex iron-sulfur subunit